jgi:colicin import membrane protein
MPPKPSPKQKAADKQAELEVERASKAAAQKEKQDAADWADGAKDSARSKAAEEKEAERRRKAAENADLLAAEEAELGKIVRTGKAAKKSGKDDFALLNDALSKQPKSKAQKDAEAKKAAEAARRKQEDENREKKEAQRKVEYTLLFSE